MSVRIFVSAVSDEFGAYREQLRHDLTSHNVDVKIQEDFQDYGVVTLEKLDLYIANCDLVVHLVGEMTGQPAKPESAAAILMKYPDLLERFPPLAEALARREPISYTQWEAWLAMYHRRMLLIAKADASAPRGPGHSPSGESQAAQQLHLARLGIMERYPGPKPFTSPDQLWAQILSRGVLKIASDAHGKGRHGVTLQLPTGAVVCLLAVLGLAPVIAERWSSVIGVSLAGPLALLAAFFVLSVVVIFGWYFGLLGASDAPAGSPERNGYDQFRANLAGGGHVTRLYSEWLVRFLGAVDRFFGDAGIACRAFGLKNPAPLWTARALDRCLLLALLYPIATIYVMWTISGHAGPAETALGLRGDVAGWRRGIAIAGIGGAMFVLRLHFLSSRRVSLGRLAVAVAVAVAVTDINATGLAVAIAFTVAVFVADTRAVTFSFTVTFTVAISVTLLSGRSVEIALILAFNDGGYFDFTAFSFIVVAFIIVGVMAITGIVAAARAVTRLNDKAISNRSHGSFLLIYLVVMISLCLLAAGTLPSSVAREFAGSRLWEVAGPLLLFLGFLTLLNAPFDWASLGLTRALLRRGVELGGWWPFLLALLDALLAGVIIALLAITMVLGVQAFDALAMHGGAKPVLPLRPLFDGIAADPGAPEYWWVYVMVLSTMIPSLFNLVIGGTALMRGLPGLSSLMLRFLPIGSAVRTYDRAWIATALTLQAVLGAALGVAVQIMLAYGLLVHVMPAVGLVLLDLCRDLADLDLPNRIIRALGGR